MTIFLTHPFLFQNCGFQTSQSNWRWVWANATSTQHLVVLGSRAGVWSNHRVHEARVPLHLPLPAYIPPFVLLHSSPSPNRSILPSSNGCIIFCLQSCIDLLTIAQESCLQRDMLHACNSQSAAANTTIIDHRCLPASLLHRPKCARSFSFYKIQYGGSVMVPPF